MPLVEADNEILLPVGGYLAWRMIAAVSSWIMEAPKSPTSRIISTTMPYGPGALPTSIRDSLLNHISGDLDGFDILIGILIGSNPSGLSFHWWFIRQVVWIPVKANVEKSLVVL